MAFASGLLGKMKMIFYPDSKLPGIPPIPFPLQYNPTKFQVSRDISYDDQELPGVGDIAKRFININPRVLSLTLNFDGTGASPSNLGVNLSLGVNLVDVQIALFLKLATTPTSDAHEPMRVLVVWGTFIMTGVVVKAVVSYSLFGRDGRPLRASIDVTIAEEKNLALALADLAFSSADVTKSITVLEGDTLPNLCQREYGDPSLYTQIANVNHLDDFRKLKPGMQLLFPPLQETL